MLPHTLRPGCRPHISASSQASPGCPFFLHESHFPLGSFLATKLLPPPHTPALSCQVLLKSPVIFAFRVQLQGHCPTQLFSGIPESSALVTFRIPESTALGSLPRRILEPIALGSFPEIPDPLLWAVVMEFIVQAVLFTECPWPGALGSRWVAGGE